MNDKKREDLSDEEYEKVFKITSQYVFTELEKTIAYDEKSDSEREDILKAVAKTIEITTVVLNEIYLPDSLDRKKLDVIFDLLKEQKFEDAHTQLFSS